MNVGAAVIVCRSRLCDGKQILPPYRKTAEDRMRLLVVPEGVYWCNINRTRDNGKSVSVHRAPLHPRGAHAGELLALAGARINLPAEREVTWEICARGA